MKKIFSDYLSVSSLMLVFVIPSASTYAAEEIVYRFQGSTAVMHDSIQAVCDEYIANIQGTLCDVTELAGTPPYFMGAACQIDTRTDQYACPAPGSGTITVRYFPVSAIPEQYGLFDPNNNQNPQQCDGWAGNPVDITSGNKYQHEPLLKIESAHPIIFDLYFNSKRTERWRHSFSRSANNSSFSSVARYDFAKGSTVDTEPFSHESNGGFTAKNISLLAGVKTTASFSAPYLTREETCRLGWAAHKMNYRYSWLPGSTAEFVSGGKCKILDAQGNQKMLLDIYSLYSGRPAMQVVSSVQQYLRFTRADGNVIIFSNLYWRDVSGVVGPALSSTWLNESNTGERAENLYTGTTHTGYRYYTADDTLEDYDLQGRLLTITAADGHVQTLSYDVVTGLLRHVQNETGEYLDFNYQAFGSTNQYQRLTSVTDHTGRSWGFRYSTTDNLEYVDNPDGTTRRYHYENTTDKRLLTGITDERGIRYATWANTYSQYGVLTATTSAHGANADINKVRIDYYGSGERYITTQRKSAVTGITTPIASTYTTHTGGGAPLVANISGPGCSTCGSGQTQYEHNAQTGNLEYKIEHGVKTSYGNYDSNGNPGYILEADGTPQARRTDYTYDARFSNKVLTITEPSVRAVVNKITTHVYDTYGNVTATTLSGYKPDGTAVSRTTTYTYNGPYHQLSQLDGPRSDVNDIFTLSYYPTNYGNNSARLQTVTAPNNLVLRNNIQYTATGKLQSEYRGNLYITYTYYSGNDRLQRITQFDGTTFASRISEWTYLATGEVATIKTGAGTADETTLTLGYDSARRLTRITDGLGNYMEYVLDSEGNVEKENIYDSSNNLKKTLTQTFDNYNRLDNFAEKYQASNADFNADGTLDKTTDGKGKITDYTYDALKRLTSVTQDLNGTDITTANAITQLGYDAQDNLISVKDANNAQTSYVYDDLGNVLSETSADTGTTTYTHDAAGNIKTRKTAKNQTFTYTYDALNRVTLQDGPNSNEDITFTYDSCSNGTGRLCSLTKLNASVTYAYDAMGNVTAHQSVNYSYDAAGRLKTMSYPSGAVVTYVYDAAGQVSSVQLNRNGTLTQLISNATHQPFGATNSLLYGNGQSLQQTFNDDYRLQAQNVGALINFNYTQYDLNGNLQQRNSELFNYDAHNRLDTASGTFGSRDYAYNKTGNRTQQISGATTTNYSYTASSNRITAVGAASAVLDANGNLTSQGTRQYNYSPGNRLITAYNSSSTLGSYKYNGLSQRSSKTVSGTTTNFSYGLHNELLVETTGATSREYIYLDGQPLAILNNTLGTSAGTGITTATTPATKGSALGFAWSGISNPKPFDWVGIYAVGTADSWSSLDSWMYTNGNASGNLSLNLQTTDTRLTTGQSYELRLYADDSYNRLATSAPFVLNPSGATIIASSTPSTLGGTLTVAWSGITSPTANDWIGVYATVSADVSELNWIYTNGTSAGSKTLTLNDSRLVPGQQYELRLFRDNSYTRLATGGTFTLTATSGTPASSKLYYIHNDHLGTPKVLTNETGNTVWSATHDPFGAATITTSTVEFNLRMPGQYFDKETGLYYNLNRYYDPNTGRYISSDPIGLNGGINTFAYVENNPVNGIDPTGLNVIPGPGGIPIPIVPIIPPSLPTNPDDIGPQPVFPPGVSDAFNRAADALLCWKYGMCSKPPKDAEDPNGAKAPGKPGDDEGYCPGKNGPKWSPSPNGPGHGWEDENGDVWVPTGPGSRAHGGPHWDVQLPGGGHVNVYPGGRRR